ncbi:MAG: DUF885 domain-containing protein [Gemmatimonadota bacterium]
MSPVRGISRSHFPIRNAGGVLLAALLSVVLAAGCEPEETMTSEVDSDLGALLDEAWEFELREDPLRATGVGDHRYDAELPEVGEEAEARRAEARRDLLVRLEAIDREALEEQDRMSHDVLERDLQDRLGEYEYRAYLIPFTSDDGFHIQFARLPGSMPFQAVADYENYLERLRAWPGYMEAHLDLLREGLESGHTMPRVILGGLEGAMASHVVDDPEESLFWGPFERFPSTIGESEQTRLAEEGRTAISDYIVPGYRDLHEFFTQVYIPGARTTIGASELPDGREFYAHRVRSYTTLDMTPEEVHQIGLDEVARIRTEMQEVIDEVGFEGGFDEFLEFLRTDPQFYASTPEELLKEASYLAKQMDERMPRLFGYLPRLPYGVAPVPDHLAPNYTGGRYFSAPPGGTQPGYYWVNTYGLENRPLYTLEALTLHEAVPGHHHQIALGQELEGLPPIRRHTYHSAFGEGWGLYSEWLGLEVGMYSDPYSNFGRLVYEMWRACRLVVDTGMHHMGWTREETMDFLAENTALSLHEIRTETDRYISWPGQAVSYKIGELKLKELRIRAEDALGPEFDLREFHDLVLANGSVPLSAVEDAVDRWIANH